MFYEEKFVDLGKVQILKFCELHTSVSVQYMI